MPGEPAEETPRRRRIWACSVDVVMYSGAPHTPASHIADAKEGDVDRPSATRGALTQAVATPGLTSRRRNVS